MQRLQAGGTYYISRDRLFPVVDDILGDSPDGVGILRHVTRVGEQIERFEQLEGWGFENNLHGVPLAYVPIKMLANEAMTTYGCDASDPRVRQFFLQNVAFVDDFLKKHAKNPELLLLLESETYTFAQAIELGQIQAEQLEYEWLAGSPARRRVRVTGTRR